MVENTGVSSEDFIMTSVLRDSGRTLNMLLRLKLKMVLLKRAARLIGSIETKEAGMFIKYIPTKQAKS